MADTQQIPIFERGSYPQIYSFSQFYVAARLVSALAGVGTVLLTYMLVRRLSGQRVAILAAAITAVMPALVVHSHYATPDSLFSFMIILSLYLLLRAYDNWHSDSAWPFLGAAFVCGLATGTKYNGAILLVPLLLVPVFRTRTLDEWISARVLAAPFSYFLGFLLATPYALLNLPLFLHWAGYALRLYNAPGQAMLVPSWQWHLDYLVTSRDAPVFIAGLAGFGFALHQWGKRGLILASFALMFCLAIVTQTNRHARMWLPLFPIFAAWASLILALAAGILRRRLAGDSLYWQRFVASYSLPVAAALVIVPALTFSLLAVMALQAPDVRSATAAWIEQTIAPGSRIALDYFPPNVNPDRWPVVRTFRHSDYDLAWYKAQGVEYLVFSEGLYQEGNLTPVAWSSYNTLLAQLCFIEVISGPFLSNPGHTMRIYRLPPCA